MASDVTNKAIPSTSGGLAASAVFPLTNKSLLAAAEGSYFIARNPTPGTAIAGHAASTTLDDTKALMVLKNNAPIASGINIYLDFIRLRLGSAGTAGTNVRFDMKLDYISRYSSGGSTLVPVNVNGNTVLGTNALVYFGAATCVAAGGNIRVLDGHELRPVIGVVGDSYTLNFAGPSHPPTALITSGSAIAHCTVNFPPVVIGPQQSLLLHQWSASQSGAYTFEPTIGWYER